MSSAINDDSLHAPYQTHDEVADRLARLERAIAAMQDTQLMEERLLQRVIKRVDELPPQATLAPPAPPVATPVPPENGSANNMLLGAGMALLPGALRAVTSELNSATDPRRAQGVSAPARSWFLTDLVLDVRTAWVMCFDFRFRTSWTFRVIPLVCLILAVVDALMLGGLFGSIAERILLVLLTVIAFKALTRETQRYRAETGYLQPRS